MRWTALLAIVMGMFGALAGWGASVAAQSPVDPLHVSPGGAGRFEYGLGLAAVPRGVAVPGGGAASGLYGEYRFALRAEGRYYVTDRIALGAGLRWAKAAGRLVVPSAGEKPSPWAWGPAGVDGSVGVVWRVAPDDPRDPEIGLHHNFGEGGGALLHGTVRRIADPVAASGGLSLQRFGSASAGAGTGSGSGGVQVGVHGGFDFVLNDEFVFSAHVLHRFPSPGQPLPATAFAFGWRTNRTFDGSGTEYDIVFTEQGGAVAVQLGVAWRGGGFLRGAP